MDSKLENQVCCLIIAYKPTEGLINLINIISPQVSKVIIVDNNSNNDIIEKIEKNFSGGKIVLLKNPDNVGIAKALNQGIVKANELGFDWVVTFDQDSKPLDNIIYILTEAYNFFPDKGSIGAIGINFFLEANRPYYPSLPGVKARVKDYLITSGCLMSVKVFYEVGGFREDFFIDNVDLEYSLRLSLNNKRMLITSECGMYHDPGHPLKKVIFGITFFSSNHNSLRRYYMAKNHVILTKGYFLKFPYFVFKMNYFFLIALFKLIIVEKNRKNKIMQTFRGLKNGLLSSSKFYSSVELEQLNTIN